LGDGLVIAVTSYIYKFVIGIASLEGVPLMSVHPVNLRFSALRYANN
jgi:hypothetical protein|tara:strand:+ start:10117 stop:10257 length:141 start_codon:yes stop_codon:yes gene_type:complete